MIQLLREGYSKSLCCFSLSRRSLIYPFDVVIALVQLELIYTPLPFIGLAFVKHLTIDIFIDIWWVNVMLKVRRFVKTLSLEVQKYFVSNIYQ
jgi:hypothetical protein